MNLSRRCALAAWGAALLLIPACRAVRTETSTATYPAASEASPAGAYLDEERSAMAAEDQQRSQEALKRQQQTDNAQARQKLPPRDPPLRPAPSRR